MTLPEAFRGLPGSPALAGLPLEERVRGAICLNKSDFSRIVSLRLRGATPEEVWQCRAGGTVGERQQFHATVARFHVISLGSASANGWLAKGFNAARPC